MLTSRNAPSGPLFTACLYPDKEFVTVTSASAINAPVGSVTTPVIVPAFPSDCPCATRPVNTIAITITPTTLLYQSGTVSTLSRDQRKRWIAPCRQTRPHTNTTAAINLVIEPSIGSVALIP